MRARAGAAVRERWRQAQAAENEFWTGVGADTVAEILRANEEAADLLRSWLPEQSSPAVEIGIGGLGVGLLGFVDSIPVRIGIDPLPLIYPDCNEDLLQRVLALRNQMQFIKASGEHLPFPNGYAGLVVCSNVLDHVNDASQVLQEIFRVLQPNAMLFLRVDTFSYLGLAKWNLWTKRRHANEILVRAHPYRFLEHRVRAICRAAGFEIVRSSSRGMIDRWVGHSSTATFLAKKPPIALRLVARGPETASK